MVASSNADVYTPFQQAMISEEGPQSSEEGSGLHSPVFTAPYPTHGDSFRYQHDQLDVHQPPNLLSSQYDYPLNAQQPPILDSALELPNSSARHVTFPSQYAIPPRNQLGIDFSAQPSINSRIPPATTHSGQSVDYRYSPTSERRLPGGPSHEPSYTRPSGTSSVLAMDHDHKPSLVSTGARTDTTPAPQASSSSKVTRKEISSVVIACRQCRSRKIRCDSTRPGCNNCARRSNECEYDLVPKRRGPDKRPGTRQRSCKKRPADGSDPPPPKRKRTTTTTERSTEQREVPPSRVKENMQDPNRSSPPSRHLDRHPQDPHYSQIHPQTSQVPPSPTDLRISTDPNAHYKTDLSAPYRRPPSYMYEQGSYTKSSYPRQLDVNTFKFPDSHHHRKFPGPPSPSTETAQHMWWNKILSSDTLDDIAAELTFLVNNTGHLLSFINLHFLLKRLSRQEERLRIQPSFILSILAMAKLMKSSTMELGAEGMRAAMVYVSDAHAAYNDSINSQWIDATLAEAALILALFESSAHPHHTDNRATNALLKLDEIIMTISLTTIDTNDRDVCLFSPNNVPMVLVDSGSDIYSDNRRCACFPPDAIDPPNPYGPRTYILPWDNAWSSDEIRDEEIRRLCWSALSLISEYIAQCEAFNEDPPRFYLSDPTNFGILFPGEVLDRISPSFRASDSLSPKESVWALYCRSMLLWNFCNRFRQPSQEEERAEQSHEAFLEVQAIEDSLNAHQCNLDTTLIYTTREYIHNIRMLVTQALRCFHGIDNGRSAPGPIFKRKQAEDWLFYENRLIAKVNTVVHQLSGPDGPQLTRRPYRINWFINQLTICLVLWNHDPTLDDALKLAKQILGPIDVLNALWPCHSIQQKCDSLRQQLVEACISRNIEQPFPPSYTVPAFLRSR